ncbi:hypothetical protein FRB96_008277 [Tulasnella sp. 330]|nr:hypothetical protein FRB96_008277 [Tulasnella sp. 330]
MFSKELQRRPDEDKMPILSIAVDPRTVDTAASSIVRERRAEFAGTYLALVRIVTSLKETLDVAAVRDL